MNGLDKKHSDVNLDAVRAFEVPQPRAVPSAFLSEDDEFLVDRIKERTLEEADRAPKLDFILFGEEGLERGRLRAGLNKLIVQHLDQYKRHKKSAGLEFMADLPTFVFTTLDPDVSLVLLSTLAAGVIWNFYDAAHRTNERLKDLIEIRRDLLNAIHRSREIKDKQKKEEILVPAFDKAEQRIGKYGIKFENLNMDEEKKQSFPHVDVRRLERSYKRTTTEKYLDPISPVKITQRLRHHYGQSARDRGRVIYKNKRKSKEFLNASWEAVSGFGKELVDNIKTIPKGRLLKDDVRGLMAGVKLVKNYLIHKASPAWNVEKMVHEELRKVYQDSPHINWTSMNRALDIEHSIKQNFNDAGKYGAAFLAANGFAILNVVQGFVGLNPSAFNPGKVALSAFSIDAGVDPIRNLAVKLEKLNYSIESKRAHQAEQYLIAIKKHLEKIEGENLLSKSVTKKKEVREFFQQKFSEDAMAVQQKGPEIN